MDESFAAGIVIPKRRPVAIKYLNEAREYNDEDNDIYKQKELTRMYEMARQAVEYLNDENFLRFS